MDLLFAPVTNKKWLLQWAALRQLQGQTGRFSFLVDWGQFSCTVPSGTSVRTTPGLWLCWCGIYRSRVAVGAPPGMARISTIATPGHMGCGERDHN